MAETYSNIINFNYISNPIVMISCLCIIIYTIISCIKKPKKEITNNKKINVKKRTKIIEIIGSIFISLLMILFYSFLIKIHNIITYIAIPSGIFTIYIVYLRPILKLSDDPFLCDYSIYGNILVTALIINSKINYLDYFQKINSDSVSQVMTIIFSIIQIYLILYCLIVNCYFLIKSFSIFNITKIESNFCKFQKYLEKNISFENLKLTFKKSYGLFYSNKNKFCKIFMFIPFFMFDVVYCTLFCLLSYSFTIIINPICMFIEFTLKILNKISNTNENKINYGISKITLILSLVITYLLIQMNNTIFQERLISTYEYISTAILIPIILESLLSMKINLELIHKNENLKKFDCKKV